MGGGFPRGESLRGKKMESKMNSLKKKKKKLIFCSQQVFSY